MYIVIPYGEESGDEIKLPDANLIGPLELATPIYLYNRNLSQLYVSNLLVIGIMVS